MTGDNTQKKTKSATVAPTNEVFKVISRPGMANQLSVICHNMTLINDTD